LLCCLFSLILFSFIGLSGFAISWTIETRTQVGFFISSFFVLSLSFANFFSFIGFSGSATP